MPVSAGHRQRGALHGGDNIERHTGSILVIEDDPDICELLEVSLKGEGHDVAAAADGSAAWSC